MKKVLLIISAILLNLFLLCPVNGKDTSDEEQIVLTIGDSKARAGHRHHPE